MKSLVKTSLVLACSLLMPISASAEMIIEGLIKHDTIMWIDESPGDNFISVPWPHAQHVETTSKDYTEDWCVGVGTRFNSGGTAEGSYNGGPDRKVTLTRRGGSESVTMDLQYIAAEWLLESEPTLIPHPSGAGADKRMELHGNIAKVFNDGKGYMSTQCLRFPKRVIGVKRFRPVITFSESQMREINSKFKTGEYPKGIYEGRASFEANWMNRYYSNSTMSSWTTTVASKKNLLFQIYFEGDRITEIVVTGEDVIVPDTTSNPDYVQGKTEYNVEVKGIISNGVKVTLAKPNSDFSLKPLITEESETNKIPYSVYCRECDGSGVLMIENGKAVDTTGYYGLVHNDFRGVEAHFEVSFTDKLLKDLYNDTYLGSFTLLFELEL